MTRLENNKRKSVKNAPKKAYINSRKIETQIEQIIEKNSKYSNLNSQKIVSISQKALKRAKKYINRVKKKYWKWNGMTRQREKNKRKSVNGLKGFPLERGIL